jgi:hypothetical protein
MGSGVVTGILECLGNSFDGCTNTSIIFSTVDSTGSFTGVNINDNIFDGQPSVGHINCNPAASSTSGRVNINDNSFIQNSGTPSGGQIGLVHGGNYMISGNQILGNGTDTGIIVAAAVSNSFINGNLILGTATKVSNSSASTTVSNTGP